MSYTEASSDYQETLPIFRQISLQGTISELWSRAPQDKPVLLRMQSMLPQFKITSEVLQDLWTLHSGEGKTSLVCTAYKYSPAHFLSLKVTEVHYVSRGRNIPPADYLICLSSQPSAQCAERLRSEEKMIEKMMKSIERRITREQCLEPLDICRTLLIFAADKNMSKLQIKCEILYPSISFQFTPISPLKLVSTPLSVKLTQNKRDKFQAGYLTMDQSGRVLPLLPSDPLAYKYPIVGIWVSGIPESQNSKACPIMHPLVWANCVQYIENTNIKDKISPSLEENAFLFLHFSSKPKFYEASTVGNPCWKTSRFCSELHKEDGLFAPIYATFVREDQSSSSLEISMNLPRPMQSFTPVAVNSGYSKPPRQSVSPSNALSNRSSDSFKHMYSPSAEKIIQEQSKMLAQLQAQILELQAHIFSSTPQSRPANAFTPNRKSESKDFFNETPKLKKSISNASDLFNLPRPSRVKGETPRLRKSNSGSSDSFHFGKLKEEEKNYNPLRYSNKSPEPSPLPITKAKVENPSENTIYVPKINYDSGSESSFEDDQVEAVQRKYLEMETERALTQIHSTAPADFEVFSVRWSPDDSHLAAGCSDGTVKLYSGKFSTIIRSMNCRLTAETFPVTSVRWRPDKGVGKTKNVLLVTTCDGGILHWHASSGKILHSHRIQDNQALCADYNTEGTYFAVGCRDRSIKVFDEGTKERIADLTGGDQQHLGHDNRIMSVKFIDHNYILSGGWDNNILIWDMRNTQVIRSFYGPRVYGDSLDVKGDMILAGSYNIEEQVQLWTMSEGRCNFSMNLASQGKSCMAYSAQFSKWDYGKVFAVGGIGLTQMYLFDTETKTVKSQINNIPKSVYSLDFANSSELLAVGSADGTVRVFTYGEPPTEHLELEE